jgi:hypothetical protein
MGVYSKGSGFFNSRDVSVKKYLKTQKSKIRYFGRKSQYTESDSKIGMWHRRHLKKLQGSSFFKRSSAPEFVSGAAGAEAAKLEKFSDGSRTQIQRLPDVVRADF